MKKFNFSKILSVIILLISFHPCKLLGQYEETTQKIEEKEVDKTATSGNCSAKSNLAKKIAYNFTWNCDPWGNTEFKNSRDIYKKLYPTELQGNDTYRSFWGTWKTPPAKSNWDEFYKDIAFDGDLDPIFLVLDDFKNDEETIFARGSSFTQKHQQARLNRFIRQLLVCSWANTILNSNENSGDYWVNLCKAGSPEVKTMLKNSSSSLYTRGLNGKNCSWITSENAEGEDAKCLKICRAGSDRAFKSAAGDINKNVTANRLGTFGDLAKTSSIPQQTNDKQNVCEA
jgi:hypothetical protein